MNSQVQESKIVLFTERRCLPPKIATLGPNPGRKTTKSGNRVGNNLQENNEGIVGIGYKIYTPRTSIDRLRQDMNEDRSTVTGVIRDIPNGADGTTTNTHQPLQTTLHSWGTTSTNNINTYKASTQLLELEDKVLT